ncbi:MAG: hypothetical protein WCD44_03845 [Candidatus Babeliales bacterium]
MTFITIFISILLSIVSTAIMSYIAMATPIGPWIAPTLVLFSLLLFRLFYKKPAQSAIILSVVSGSIGGIVATACGFSFPTLYFLNPTLFSAWMARPIYFASILTGLVLGAGWLGIWIANVTEHKLIVQEKLAFPIGQLIYKMITVQEQVKKAYELMIGFIGTLIFCLLQDGTRFFAGIIPKTIMLLSSTQAGVFVIPLIQLDVWPLLWAIGFVTGHVIALPLAVGIVMKIILINPLHASFFSYLSNVEFSLAFCSGIVLSGLLNSFMNLPKQLWRIVRKIKNKDMVNRSIIKDCHHTFFYILELSAILLFLTIFLHYLQFSLLAQVYLILFTSIYTYQIISIAGKIGLALLGRFATFVMVPAMFLFNLDSVHLVFIATFVEICGGVATDILFGRKVAQLSATNHIQLKRFQYLGLGISALVVGFIFWLLINHLTLGSPELFAQRAQARQLLIYAKHFDYWILFIGTLVGFLLKYVKINPMLVLGGLLMPINFSLGLIAGGFLARIVPQAEECYPFWSGVFASNSLWIVIKTMF